MSTRKAFYEEFAAKVIAMLENGTAPWQKPWTPVAGLAPFNPVSGVTYKGINRLWLAMFSTGDPRWMTSRQAEKAGYTIREGSRSVPIWYYFTREPEDKLDENGWPVPDQEGYPKDVARPQGVSRVHQVFNALDIEGLPPLEVATPHHDWEPLEKAEEILSRSGAVIKHDQTDNSFYSITRDEIHLPPKHNFDAPDKYYATALHELGHWTGHESRMARPFEAWGTEDYAKEELRVEIASWMLGQDIGVGHDPSQHAAYVRSWIAVLENDPLELRRACRDAERITQYIIGLELGHTPRAGHETASKQKRRSTAPGKDALDAARGSQRVVPALEKTWLLVPYREKNTAKRLGAKFDWDERRWFAPKGVDLGPLRRWLPAAER